MLGIHTNKSAKIKSIILISSREEEAPVLQKENEAKNNIRRDRLEEHKVPTQHSKQYILNQICWW